MPELCRFYGIVIRMQAEADERHHTPHIHVKYGGYTASVSIDGETLAGKLPATQLRLVQVWLFIHYKEVQSAWDCLIDEQLPPDIEPLR